ncbi:MAG: hypothetical protein ACWIPJ_10125 [Polaribacter sp.]
MIDIWGTKDFQTLYKDFRTNSSRGKIFMMKDYECEDTVIGKGVTVLLRKASLVILGVLKELYIKDSSYMIGNIGLLFALVDQRKKKAIQQLKNQKEKMLAKSSKQRIQLHSILRKQKSLNPLKFKIELQKEKE